MVMYEIGEKIVYPMHGAGIIVDIEEKEVFGQTLDYYILKMPFEDMRVMIPVKTASNVGLRHVIDHVEVDEVLEYFKTYDEEENSNWNKRYRENVDRIKTGNIYSVAQVVKMLMCRENERGLSTGERKMLISSKQILISELVLAKGLDSEQLEGELDQIVKKLA